MGYKLKYHTNLCKDLKSRKVREKPAVGSKWVFLAIILVLAISISKKDFLIDFLIPGNSAVTVSAVDTFAENIQLGIPIDEAFAEFCLEIVKSE